MKRSRILTSGSCALLAVGMVLAESPKFARAHDFELRDSEGGRQRLSDALAKGPVLLDFWATWCAPCKLALPRWSALADKYAEHGVQLLAISQDDPRSQPKIQPYLRSQGFRFAALLDGDKQVGRRYQVMTLPTTLLIASDGRIVLHHVGYKEGDERELERELRALLGLEAAAAVEVAPH